MKSVEKKVYTVIRMCLAVAGMICVILSMRTGDNSQTYLTIGLGCIAVANIISCKGYCIFKKDKTGQDCE